jgi:hypothetical protein
MLLLLLPGPGGDGESIEMVMYSCEKDWATKRVRLLHAARSITEKDREHVSALLKTHAIPMPESSNLPGASNI